MSSRNRYGLTYLVVFCIAAIGIWLRLPGSGPAPGSCVGCNVIVISVGTFRADRLPCYGYRRQTTPVLCAFAERAYVYERAYATASKTLDASFSLLTGLYPSSHGMTVPFSSVLHPKITTLPQLLRADGYRTLFMGPSGDPHLPLAKGFGRGFEETYDADDPAAWTRVFSGLRREASASARPFFAYLHSYMPHEPYMPEPADIRRFYDREPPVVPSYDTLCADTYRKLRELHPDRLSGVMPLRICDAVESYRKTYAGSSDFDETYAMANDAYWQEFEGLGDAEKAGYTSALYDARLFEFDRELGAFLSYASEAGILKNSIVVITGDHGDEFFEHGGYSHGYTLYSEVIRVPLVISVPGFTGARVRKLASTVDILPTILALIGARMEPAVSGINLFSRAEHRAVLAEHVSDGLYSVVSKRYAFFSDRTGNTETKELYALQNDPEEQKNIYRNHSGIAESMERIYRIMQRSSPSFPRMERPFPDWMRQQEKDRLIRTGYF